MAASSTAPVLRDSLARAAAETPRAAAVIESRRRATRVLSWSELAETSASWAASLRRRLTGGSPAARPALVVPVSNTLEGVLRLVAALSAELPVFPVGAATPAPELARLMDLVADAHGTAYRMPRDPDGAPERVAGPPSAPAADADVDYLLAGGGTSGRPRLSAGSFGDGSLTGLRLLLRRTGWRERTRQIVLGPLSHSAPFLSAVAGLADRHTLVVQGVFSPDRAVATIAEHGVEWLQVTPSHMRRMLEAAPRRGDLARLRGLLHTAAPCDVATKRAWLDLLGPERVFEMYGATEQIGMTLARGDEWLSRPGTVGKGFLTQLRILDDDGAVLPPGRVGTVFMRRGSRRSRALAGAAPGLRHTVDGFLSVGDQGRLDEDGYLHLVGRRADMMTVGGSNVYPAEIERVVLELPGVRDVAVVAHPHADLGSVPHAHVVPAPGSGLTPADVARHCRAALSPAQRPRTIAFVAELPRTDAGKLHRWRVTNHAQEDTAP
ncbi:AMP-binding protein [Streptomyces sp. B6B3]|uniref:AMP-binding protein n=1 Tax=Streptomyces sp. B6B3 TaxID=3153570 RepID=UPI00325E883E